MTDGQISDPLLLNTPRKGVCTTDLDIFPKAKLEEWKLKQKLRIALLTAVVTLFIGNTIYHNHLVHVALLAKINKYELLVEKYHLVGKSCKPYSDLPTPNYVNNPRSDQRVSSVWNYYLEVMKAKCFLSKDLTIYSNPYRGLESTKWGASVAHTPSYEILQGFLFDIDKGMPFMMTGGSICSDGSFSPSTGRGTCSWHGGYGKQRGNEFTFQFSKQTYDPRKVLSKLQNHG